MSGAALVENAVKGVAGAAAKATSPETLYNLAEGYKSNRAAIQMAAVLPRMAVNAPTAETKKNWPEVHPLAEVAIGFVPFVGPTYDIAKGAATGNVLQIGLGVAFLALDFITFGGASLLRGGVKAGIKASEMAIEVAMKQGLHAVAQKASQDVVEQVAKNLLKKGAKTELLKAVEGLGHEASSQILKLAAKEGAEKLTQAELKIATKELSKKLLEEAMEEGGKGAFAALSKSITEATKKAVLHELKTMGKFKNARGLEKYLIDTCRMKPTDAAKASEELLKLVKSGAKDDVLKQGFEDVITNNVMKLLKGEKVMGKTQVCQVFKGDELLGTFEKTVAKDLEAAGKFSKAEVEELAKAAREGAEEGLEAGVRKAVRKGIDEAFKEFRKKKDIPSVPEQKTEDKKNVNEALMAAGFAGFAAPKIIDVSEAQKQHGSARRNVSTTVADRSGTINIKPGEGDGIKSFLVANTSTLGISDKFDYHGGLRTEGSSSVHIPIHNDGLNVGTAGATERLVVRDGGGVIDDFGSKTPNSSSASRPGATVVIPSTPVPAGSGSTNNS